MKKIKKQLRFKSAQQRQLEQDNNDQKHEIQELRKDKSKMHDEMQMLLKQDNFKKGERVQQLEKQKKELADEKGKLQKEEFELGMDTEILKDKREKALENMADIQKQIDSNSITIKQLQRDDMSLLIKEEETVCLSKNDEIGRGSYGVVYKGEYYGSVVAIKEIHAQIESKENLEIFKREMYIASQCRHPNLLQFICAMRKDQNRLLIVTELMDMSLRECIGLHQTPSVFPFANEEVMKISLDVACGLDYLHSKKPTPLVHRDISSANVLLWVEKSTVRGAKISDYGSANFLAMCNTPCAGAAIYAAPEANQNKQSPKIDIFSYGILFCEISICELPNPDNRRSQFDRIENEGIKKLVEECTNQDPQARPTMHDVVRKLQCI